MGLFAELDEEQSCSELLKLFDVPPEASRLSERDIPLWYEEVAIKIAEKGPVGLCELLGRIALADNIRLRSILQALTFIPKETAEVRQGEIRQVLLRFLDHADPLVGAQAIDGLRLLGHRDILQRILPLVEHPSPYVAGSALRFLARWYPEIATGHLLSALQAPEPILRQVAIDELDDLQYVEALPAVRRLLFDPNQYVRQAAQTAVANLQDR